MKNAQGPIGLLCLIIAPLFICIPLLFAATAGDYYSMVPFGASSPPANVLLNLSVEKTIQAAAYNDYPYDFDGDLDQALACKGRVIQGTGDGRAELGVCYAPRRTYLGLFDPDKEYRYDPVNLYFYPVRALKSDHSLVQSGTGFSGNYMNWATMTVIDELRWMLTGGNRVVDNDSFTVVERARLSADGVRRDLFPVKSVGERLGSAVDPQTVLPWKGGQVNIVQAGGNLVSFYQVESEELKVLQERMVLRIRVCDPEAGLEDNCKPYGGGQYYKPEGLIQQYSDQLRFGLMLHGVDGEPSRDGSILRAEIKSVGPYLPDYGVNPAAEWGEDGLLVVAPDTAGATNVSGVINTINKFSNTGYPASDPVAESFYECLNYFKNREPTPGYTAGLSSGITDGLPVFTTWSDPFQGWCQPGSIVTIHDGSSDPDKRLPGTFFTTKMFNGLDLKGNDWGEPGNMDLDYDVTVLTDTVGALEGINGTVDRIGCVAGNCDMNAANKKRIDYLGRVMGSVPIGNEQNSYYIAGLSYYANTHDIRPDMEGHQTVKSYMIDTRAHSGNREADRMDILWLAGKYGGFSEGDRLDSNGDGNALEPNIPVEWDEDGDGQPDSYIQANTPEKLRDGLSRVFSSMAETGNGVRQNPVISGSCSSQGVVYQSMFYPELSDSAIPANTVQWAGRIHGLFIDSSGRLREDGNHNQILDSDDDQVVFVTDNQGTPVVEKYSLQGAVAEQTIVTIPVGASRLDGTYFQLDTVHGGVYVWFEVDESDRDPEPTEDRVGIKVALRSQDTAYVVSGKTAAAINGVSWFNANTNPVTGQVRITHATPGEVEDALPGTSGVLLSTPVQGSGETWKMNISGTTDDVAYLWETSTWLNQISDSEVIQQRVYDEPEARRYIFTFIDWDEDMVADPGELQPFAAPDQLTIAQLKDTTTVFPYVPISDDSRKIPVFVSGKRGNLVEFLQLQTRRVINFIRGEDQPALELQTGSGGTLPAFRSRTLDMDNDGEVDVTWRLGDIVSSAPVAVAAPKEAYHLLYRDASYGAFVSRYLRRRTVIYAGGNDGMFHAFNGGFHESRFDVYPEQPDGVLDNQLLTRPRNASGQVAADTAAEHDLGAELWAYIPYNLLPHLYWLTSPGYRHVWYADLKPRVFDARVFSEEDACLDPEKGRLHGDCIHPYGWGTVLVGGMRLGGGRISVDMDRTDGDMSQEDRTMQSAYFILDITNPEQPPDLLAEITFPTLGYTTSVPAVAFFVDPSGANEVNDWFLVFGSGPAEGDGAAGNINGQALRSLVSGQKPRVFVVDLGKLVGDKVVQTVAASGELTGAAPFFLQVFDQDENGYVSSPASVDYDLDFRTDAVYFGTVCHRSSPTGDVRRFSSGGKLRRVVMDDEADGGEWTGDSVLVDLELSGQPITSSPTIGLDREGNNWIFFGTGRYAVQRDGYDLAQQSFYGIKEPLYVSEFEDSVSRVRSYDRVEREDLYESTAIEVEPLSGKVIHSPTAVPAGSAMDWGDFVQSASSWSGWYYNLTTAGERSIEQAVLYGDMLSFTTYTPSVDICAPEGSSDFYRLFYLTGTAVPHPGLRGLSVANSPSAFGLKFMPLGKGKATRTLIHPGRTDRAAVYVNTGSDAIQSTEAAAPGQTRSGRIAWGYR